MAYEVPKEKQIEEAQLHGMRAGRAMRQGDQPRATFARETFRKWARLQSLPFSELDAAYAVGYRTERAEYLARGFRS
jgi:hypothetical protein